ncbi:MAG: histidine phosphatase family protein [Micrococcales bacterium 70-64]|nr:histidine phosphatase family protein [Leifsonia sp.]ODU65184.1 MAG: phosphoglycerate mutase [Leifsonia sp. SCN 70-46]OJX86876.1 MAG: histidine phosphatase family protein [Micrococcales bacterium 70-64]
MLLYLVRHGETDWNRQHRIQGLTDIPLNDTGREQARRAGRLLASRDWHAVVSSPLQRALETATIIADELGLPAPTTDDQLVERNYGEAEGLDFDELNRRFPEDAPVPGRERRSAVRKRAMAALLRIAAAHPDESVLVVAHGGLIRAVLRAVDPEGEHGMITNGSVHSFRYEDGALSLIAFDDPIEAESVEGEDLRQQNPVEARR